MGAKRTVMVPQVIETILGHVRRGLYPEEAARLAGVNPAAMRQLRKRDETFADQIAEAEAAAELDALERVQRGGRDWTSAAWWLERRHPRRWARPEIQQQLTVTPIDTEQLVASLGEFIAGIGKKHADFSQPDVEDQPGFADAARLTDPQEARP